MAGLSAAALGELRPRLLRGIEELLSDADDLRSDADDLRSAASKNPEELADTLLSYTAELYRFNDKLGLVEATPEQFIHAHLLDSLAPLYRLPTEYRRRFEGETALLDVGSGAGLPGVPIAVARPRLSVALLDRSGRRCGFLRNAVAMLRRRDIRVAQGELATAAGRVPAAGVITARAFRPLTVEVYRELRAVLEPEGVLILYKGRYSEANAELEALLRSLHAAGEGEPSAAVYPVDVPGLDRERCVTVINPDG